MHCCAPVVPAAWETEESSLPGWATLQDASQRPKSLKGLSFQPALSPIHSGPNSDTCILFFLTTKDECFEGIFHFKYGEDFS